MSVTRFRTLRLMCGWFIEEGSYVCIIGSERIVPVEARVTESILKWHGHVYWQTDNWSACRWMYFELCARSLKRKVQINVTNEVHLLSIGVRTSMILLQYRYAVWCRKIQCIECWYGTTDQYGMLGMIRHHLVWQTSLMVVRHDSYFSIHVTIFFNIFIMFRQRIHQSWSVLGWSIWKRKGQW